MTMDRAREILKKLRDHYRNVVREEQEAHPVNRSAITIQEYSERVQALDLVLERT